MNSRTNLRQFVAHLCGWSSAATLRHTPTSGSLCQLIILCSPLCIASQIDTQPALVVFWLRICCDPSCVLLSGTAAVCLFTHSRFLTPLRLLPSAVSHCVLRPTTIKQVGLLVGVGRLFLERLHSNERISCRRCCNSVRLKTWYVAEGAEGGSVRQSGGEIVPVPVPAQVPQSEVRLGIWYQCQLRE